MPITHVRATRRVYAGIVWRLFGWGVVSGAAFGALGGAAFAPQFGPVACALGFAMGGITGMLLGVAAGLILAAIFAAYPRAATHSRRNVVSVLTSVFCVAVAVLVVALLLRPSNLSYLVWIALPAAPALAAASLAGVSALEWAGRAGDPAAGKPPTSEQAASTSSAPE